MQKTLRSYLEEYWCSRTSLSIIVKLRVGAIDWHQNWLNSFYILRDGPFSSKTARFFTCIEMKNQFFDPVTKFSDPRSFFHSEIRAREQHFTVFTLPVHYFPSKDMVPFSLKMGNFCIKMAKIWSKPMSKHFLTSKFVFLA